MRERCSIPSEGYATASARSLVTLNFTTVLAGTLMVAPVEGLRASRASRLAAESLPMPPRVTSSPFFRVLATVVPSEARMADVGLGLAGLFGDGGDQFVLGHEILLEKVVQASRAG
jgi:hypothetical protein